MAIWRADLDTASKAVLTAVRYHGDEVGNCYVSVDRIAAVSGVKRTTVFQRLADLVVAGWVERVSQVGGPNVYRVTPVRHTDGVSNDTRPPRGRGISGHPSATRTPPVRHTDGSLVTPVRQTDTPPYMEREPAPAPCNNSSTSAAEQEQQNNRTTEQQDEAEAALTPAPAPARDGLAEVIDAFRAAQPGVRDSGGILRGAGLFLSPAATAQLAVLVTDHGAPRVLEAICEAVASDSKGGVTIRFVASIAERMAKGTPKPGATQVPQHGYGRRAPQSPFRNDNAPPAGPRPVDPASGDVDF